jgi:hypothetical protein
LQWRLQSLIVARLCPPLKLKRVNDMPQDLKQAQQYAEKWLGIIRNPERPEESVGKREIFQAKISSLLPNRQDWKDSGGPIAPGKPLGVCPRDFSGDVTHDPHVFELRH